MLGGKKIFVEVEDDSEEILLKAVKKDLKKHGYKLGRVLGEGSYSIVNMVEKDGKEFACKVFRPEGLFSFIPDINFSFLFKHPYIIKSHEFIFGKFHNITIMDLGDISLGNHIMNNKDTPSNISYRDKIRYIYQIGTALDYISNMGYVHCDIKSDNIILKGDNVYLADFSLFKHKDIVDHEHCQTYSYRSPESFEGKYEEKFPDISRWSRNQIKSEMWAYGMVCLELIYNRNYIGSTGRVAAKIGNFHNHMAIYDYFLDTLYKSYGSKTPYEGIVGLLGSFSSENKLLVRVCNGLLNFDQDKRMGSYREFLDCDLFRDVEIPNIERMPPLLKKVITFLPEDHPICRFDRLDITTKWIYDICDTLKFNLVATFNSIEFYLYIVGKYSTKIRDLQLLSIVSMIIMANLNNVPHIDVSEYVYLSDHSYREEEILEMLNKVISGENCIVSIDSVYDYLPSKDATCSALIYLTNYARFKELGGTNGLVQFILSDESLIYNEKGVITHKDVYDKIDSDIYFRKALIIRRNDSKVKLGGFSDMNFSEEEMLNILIENLITDFNSEILKEYNITVPEKVSRKFSSISKHVIIKISELDVETIDNMLNELKPSKYENIEDVISSLRKVIMRRMSERK